MEVKAKEWFFSVDCRVEFNTPMTEKEAVAEVMRRFENAELNLSGMNKRPKKETLFSKVENASP